MEEYRKRLEKWVYDAPNRHRNRIATTLGYATAFCIIVLSLIFSSPENANASKRGLAAAIHRLQVNTKPDYGAIKILNDYVYTAVVPGNGGMAIGVSNTYSKTLVVQEAVEPLLTNAHWITIPTTVLTKVSTNTSVAISGNDIWYTPIHGRWVRVIDTADTSGEADIQFSAYAAGGGGSISTTTGGGGGASTIGDGADIAEGTITDMGVGNATGTVEAHLRYADTELAALLAGQNGTTPVTGTFWQSTQPVSAASLPLPTGAATQTTLASVLSALGSPFQAGTSIGNTAFVANAGTNLNTSALGLDTSLQSILTQITTVAGFGGATGSAVPAKSVYNGGIATTAIPMSTTAGNLVGAMFDKAGRIVTSPQAPRELVKHQETTITSSTSTTTVVTAGASGVLNDVTSIVFTNSSTTTTVVTLSDGTASYTFIVPATDMRGIAYNVPLAETTTATAWTVACTTSVASVIVDVCFVINR